MRDPRSLALALLVVALRAAPAPAQPVALDEIGLDQRLDARLPEDLRLRDEEGAEVAVGELLRGRPVVLSLVYHRCPMLCSEVLDGLVRSLRALSSLDVGEEFDVWTVSIDPDEDTRLAASRKKHYLERYRRPGAGSGWRFLAGTRDSIRSLTRTVGYRYVAGEREGQFAHPSGLVILTPEGRISQYFYGIEYSARDLGFALMEASASRIGSAVDQILLYCFQYDPTTGRYGVAIFAVLRLAGLATVLGLGAFVGLSLHRERRLPRSN